MRGRLTLRNCWSWGLLLALALVCALGSSGRVEANGGSIITIFPGPAYQASMKLDAEGNPVMAYGGVSLLHCNDPYCAGGDDVPVKVASGSGPSLELDAAGNPVISYVTPGALSVTHCNDAFCLGNDEHLGQLALVGPGSATTGHTSLALDAAGNPAVTVANVLISHDAVVSYLNLLHCNDPNCAAYSFLGVDDRVGNKSALAFDSSGNPTISYAESTNNQYGPWRLKVAHCGNPQCSVISSYAWPDPGGSGGDFSSLVLDSSDNPVISYPDGTGATRVVHCNDIACLGGDESALSPGAAGSGYGLDLDASDNPVFVYGSSTAGLTLFHCGDPNCQAGNSAAELDMENRTYPLAMELDAFGFPVVLYEPAADAPFRLLRCINATCTAGNDTDGDGCSDSREIQLGAGVELTGGNRNPKNPYDYFNPTHDGQNRMDDILAVVDAYFKDDNDGNPGLPPYATGYTPDTDRTLAGPNGWNLGPPNGLQRVDDILNAVHQYFHDCA